MKNAGRMTDEIIPKGIVLYKPKKQSLIKSDELKENNIS
jgi:hypothetical protein